MGNIGIGGIDMSQFNSAQMDMSGIDMTGMIIPSIPNIPSPASTPKPRHIEPAALQRIQPIYEGKLSEEGLLSFHIDNAIAKNALYKIQEAVREKRKPNAEKEIIFSYDNTKLATGGFSVTIDHSAMETLYREGIDAVGISTPVMDILLDHRAMFFLVQATDGGLIRLTATPIQSKAAESLLGFMPAFSLELTVIHDNGQAQPLPDLGGGEMSVHIRYTPREGENLRTLRALDLADDGSTTIIQGSYYAGDSVHLLLRKMQSVVVGSRGSN
ncbi:MAG: hypothetical protein FWG37_05225 [Clostridia bacterium]|nr:hypothetical protein [Clostridia bacterium]